VALLAVIAVVGWSWRGERLARLSSEASRLVTLGKDELLAEPSKALAYSIAALDLVDSPASRLLALEALARRADARIMTLPANIQATSINFSPDGKRMAIGGTGGVLVQFSDGTPPVVLEKFFTGSSRSPVFAPDGDHVICQSGKDETQIRVWSLAEGKEVRTFKMEGETWPYAIGGKLILITVLESTSTGPRRLAVRRCGFDGSDPVLVGHWDLTGVTSLSMPAYLDPKGRWVAFTKERRIYVCPIEDLRPGRWRLIGEHPNEVEFVTFDPAGERIVSADKSGEIRIWPLVGNSRIPLRTIAAEPPVWRLCFDPAGTTLAAICTPDKLVHLWDLNGPRDAAPIVLRHKGGGNKYFSPLAFDPSGQWIIRGCIDELAFWPLVRPDRYVFKGQLGFYTPDGQSLALVTSSALGIRMLNLYGGPNRDLWTAPGFVYAVDFDPSGQYAVVAAFDKGVYLVSLVDGSARQLPHEPPTSIVYEVRFSPDGRLVAGICLEVGKYQQIRVWDLEADTVRVLETSEAQPTPRIIFSEDGSIFTSGTNGNVKRWNLQDGRSTVVASSELPVVQGLAVSRDTRLLFAEFASATLWSQSSAKSELVLFDLENHTSRSITTHGSKVLDVAIDPAGTFLVTSDLDGVIRVGPSTGEEPHMLFGAPIADYTGVSPDGRWIMSSAGDTTVSIWRVPEGRPIHTLTRGKFLEYLRAQTNLRVVPDKISNSGYRVDTGPFPGWEKVPPK
jgi:WD40 repeat protein